MKIHDLVMYCYVVVLLMAENLRGCFCASLLYVEENKDECIVPFCNGVIFTVIRLYTIQDDGYVNWFSLWLGVSSWLSVILWYGISKEI